MRVGFRWGCGEEVRREGKSAEEGSGDAELVEEGAKVLCGEEDEGVAGEEMEGQLGG